MRRISKQMFFFALSSILMIIMVGCGTITTNEKTQAQGQAQGAEITVKVGDIQSAELTLPYRIALDKGFFKAEGLNIQSKIFTNGPNLMMSMANGELDFSVATGFTPMLQAAAQGTDVIILASMAKGNAPVVANANIQSFKDLDGKVLGSPGLGTIQNTMLSIAAKKYGIKFGKVINASISDLPVMLEKGEIDAFTGWEWLAADAVYRVKGAHYVLKMPVIDNAESVALGVRGTYFKEHPDVVKKFVKAYLEGVKYYKEHPEEGNALMAKLINKPLSVANMAMENVIVNDPEIDLPSLKFSIQDAIDTGKIKKDVVPDIDAFINKYVDQSVVKAEKKEVGLN